MQQLGNRIGRCSFSGVGRNGFPADLGVASRIPSSDRAGPNASRVRGLAAGPRAGDRGASGTRGAAGRAGSMPSWHNVW
jgi:hypothetical protein